jgi:Xaa-Pro aminopeptidase
MIERSEYEARWTAVQADAAKRGFDGVLVWSRGGGTVDSYADVLYLANHYSPFPLVNDNPPYWAGKSHAALLLPATGEPTLVVDIPDFRRDLIPVEDVRFALDLPAAVAAAVDERGLGAGQLGLVAGNALLVSPYRMLVDALPRVQLVPADDLVEGIRARKSPAELELMREAARVGMEVVDAIMRTAMTPGVTEAEAIAAGYKIACAAGAAMYDAPASSGPFSDYYAHGRLPSWSTRVLESGDLFHVDCYGALDGYLWDFSRTAVVGGSPSRGQLDLLEAGVAANSAGVAAARAGAKVGDIFRAVRGGLEAAALVGGDGDGQGAALLASFPAHGHSVGMSWEAPWIVPWEETAIEPGMCFGIELMGGLAGVGSMKLEQDVIITADGIEVLTTLPDYYV